MELSVLNIKGASSGKKVSLSEEVFGIEPNEHAVYLDVKHFLANQRQGTHKAKERAEVSYSTRKIKKQKGTGGARAGSIKSPVFVGGGRIFGPKPRDYDFKLNRKVKQLARASVLSSKASENKIVVLENFTFEAPKTKSYLEVLNALSLDTKKTLLVIGENNLNITLSGRNIPNAKVITTDAVNTYDLLNAEILILDEAAVSKLNQL
jgi:large subunit ribosomal protein L4